MSGGQFQFSGGSFEHVPEGKHIAALFDVQEGQSPKGNKWLRFRFRLVQHTREGRDGKYNPTCSLFLVFYDGNEDNVGIAQDSLGVPRAPMAEACKADAWKGALGKPVLVDMIHEQYTNKEGKDRTSYKVMGMYTYDENSEMFTPDIMPGQVCLSEDDVRPSETPPAAKKAEETFGGEAKPADDVPF